MAAARRINTTTQPPFVSSVGNIGLLYDCGREVQSAKCGTLTICIRQLGVLLIVIVPVLVETLK
jgi:hypothetical protein